VVRLRTGRLERQILPPMISVAHSAEDVALTLGAFGDALQEAKK